MRTWMKTMSLIVVGMLAISTGHLRAQTPAAQTASQFYIAYRAAFDKATKIEDVLPFMSADRKKQVEATPADKRAEGFQIMKMFGSLTDVKVTKEVKAGTGATLTAEGTDSDKKKEIGTIKIVREGSAWKVAEEDWK